MQEKLLAIKEAAFNEISAAENSGALEEIRVKYLGKKGELTTILRGMGSLSPEERPVGTTTIMNIIWPASEDAAIAVCPTKPSIITSAEPTAAVIRFWAAIGPTTFTKDL